jgi:hypothetical protein
MKEEAHEKDRGSPDIPNSGDLEPTIGGSEAQHTQGPDPKEEKPKEKEDDSHQCSPLSPNRASKTVPRKPRMA